VARVRNDPGVRRRWLTPSGPNATGEALGRPYALWLPEAAPSWPGMVIVHGAGSRKENHSDFARACVAAGWAALAYDQRGHGESDEQMSPAALADLGGMAGVLADQKGVDPRRTCVRGSSLGGFIAIQGAASSDAIAGAIAICPADEEHLLRGLRARTLEMRIGERERADLAAWLSEHDLRDAVAEMGAKPLLLIHARGDERVPYEISEELYERAAEPRRLILLAGGHHRSAQHDSELHGEALRWMARALER
jgi:alpha-beta hydrolase superfamily lysophospholipase